MDNFWKWLKKANARAVFFCLLAGLAVVSAWWVWKLITPIRVVPPPVTGVTHNPATPSLGILAYLQVQQAEGTNRAANLFIPPEAFNQSPPSSNKKEKPEPSTSQSKPEPRKESVKTAPAPARELVTLTYRGLWVRGDGVPMALLADSKSRRTAFYPAGTNLFGLILTTITAETLGLKCPDQTSVTLKRGVPQSFPEDRHAD